MQSNQNIIKQQKPMRQFSDEKEFAIQRNKQKEEEKRLRALARHEKMSLLAA